MIDQYLFEHPLLERAFQEMNKGNLFEKEVMFHYENYEQKKIYPDLIGKTVKVTQKQIPKLYEIAMSVTRKLGIDDIPIYVYEDFYYGVESKGLNPSWIEISAKTVTDFTEKELLFLLGREIGKVKMNYLYYDILLEQAEKAVHHQLINSDLLKDSWKIMMYRWSRLAHYSADTLGYAICGDIGSAISAILKMVLNSSYLAEQIDLMEYLAQSEELQQLDDELSRFTKMDERVPYAPFRIKHLIRYASSERGMKAIKYFQERGMATC